MLRDATKILADKIRAANTIVIMGHKNPDGDSLGACMGLRYLISENFGKKADVVYDGNLPIKYDFMPGRREFIYAEKLEKKEYDLAIVLDTAIVRQLGEVQKALLDGARDTIKIDHHKTSDDFANLNVVETSFVATCEIIYEMAAEIGWGICPDAADCLYLGVYSDTGGFSHIDNGNSLRVAAELVDHGADARRIQPNLNILTRGDILAEAEALAATEFFYDGRLAVVPVPNKLYKKLDSGEVPLLMRLRSVRGVRAIAIMKQAKPEEIHVSFRSEGVAVRPVAEKLGGGGHDMAAAANIRASLDVVKKTVVDAFYGVL
jgi:phosphoesterase RecJ-like protein